MSETLIDRIVEQFDDFWDTTISDDAFYIPTGINELALKAAVKGKVIEIVARELVRERVSMLAYPSASYFIKEKGDE
jgi:hypothetical protein